MFWHVAGVVVILAILIIVPDKHQSVDFVFTETFNNSGFSDGMLWFYVLPLGFLLTIGATFGVMVAVFQWGWLNGLLGVTATGPIMSMMPIFIIGIAFGLAIDYEVFLVTRMRSR